MLAEQIACHIQDDIIYQGLHNARFCVCVRKKRYGDGGVAVSKGGDESLKVGVMASQCADLEPCGCLDLIYQKYCGLDEIVKLLHKQLPPKHRLWLCRLHVMQCCDGR